MAQYRTIVGKDGISREFKVTKLQSKYRPSKSVMRVKGRMSNSSGRVNLLMVPADSRMGADS
jgi:hypothetical protein